MSELKPNTPRGGKVRLLAAKVKGRMRQAGLTNYDLRDRTNTDLRTINRMLAGQPVRWTSVAPVLSVLKITDFYAYAAVDPDELAATRETSSLPDWTYDYPLTPVITTANGLQYRLYKMQHRHDGELQGRGKRYEFDHCSTDTQHELRELFLRHGRTCNRLPKHPQVPNCLGSFPEPGSRAWWVIDRWQAGRTLAEVLTAGNAVAPVAAQRILAEIASGLQAFHELGIILRDLSPTAVLLTEPQQQVELTDFELAKFSAGNPSVARDWQQENPYRAPEVKGHAVDVGADIYSWGRIATHLLVGHLPQRGKEAQALAVASIPNELKDLIGRCVAVRRSVRPMSIEALHTDFHRWQPS